MKFHQYQRESRLFRRSAAAAQWHRHRVGHPNRERMSRSTALFSANSRRARIHGVIHVRAAAASHELAQDRGARPIPVQWRPGGGRAPGVTRFGELRVETSPKKHSLQVEVYLGELRTDWVQVQVYADPLDGEPPFVSEMNCRESDEPSGGWSIYAAEVPASRPASDYTPRIVPSHSGAKIPLEDAHILWFR